eukprot:64887-Prymnesium_polylepis.1
MSKPSVSPSAAAKLAPGGAIWWRVEQPAGGHSGSWVGVEQQLRRVGEQRLGLPAKLLGLLHLEALLTCAGVACEGQCTTCSSHVRESRGGHVAITWGHMDMAGLGHEHGHGHGVTWATRGVTWTWAWG